MRKYGIGDRIKHFRISLGMTQEELAHKLGYKSKSTIQKIEKGINDIPQSKIIPFSDALGISPVTLLGSEESVIENVYAPEARKSVDYLFEELSVLDGLQLALSKDEKINDYKYDDDQLREILDFARFKAGVR